MNINNLLLKKYLLLFYYKKLDDLNLSKDYQSLQFLEFHSPTIYIVISIHFSFFLFPKWVYCSLQICPSTIISILILSNFQTVCWSSVNVVLSMCLSGMNVAPPLEVFYGQPKRRTPLSLPAGSGAVVFFETIYK